MGIKTKSYRKFTSSQCGTKHATTCYLTTLYNKNPIKTSKTNGGELRCSGRVSCSVSTIGTRRVTLVTNLMISHE